MRGVPQGTQRYEDEEGGEAWVTMGPVEMSQVEYKVFLGEECGF